jgi:uroporphyrinogen-III synthase
MSVLTGWRVLVPRPSASSSSLVELLKAEGAAVEPVPLISIEPPVEAGTLDLAVLGLARGDYQWVGFTSVNAVDAVLHRALRLGLSPAVTADTRTAAVGPATADALRRAGIPVDLLPSGGGSAAALAQCWPTARAGESVLLPQSEIAKTTLGDRLSAAGFAVHAVVAYRTVIIPPAGAVAAALAAGSYQAVLLTSPSTVRALAAVPLAPGTVLGAIGDSTAAAAAAAGLHIAFTAVDPTDAALVAGLAHHAASHL